MGFDNECIVNIQSLAGEYFCPVCRTLVYPHEALQSQCTHLYCKPCLTYVVGTTKACPYDGYLVTEADSKPLTESNKALAEVIGKIPVHCLFHRSGCSWQGPLSECTSHCSGCTFGNSPVVCNRCGIQIVHRQVQEHAQTCPGANPQAQQNAESAKDTAAPGTVATANSSQTNPQPAQASQAQLSQTTTAPPPAQGSNQANANPQVQPIASAAGIAAEQWYPQQFQQYYQQYPGYDPYQQSYQQYYPYQQQTTQQVQQQAPHVPQPQIYAQHQTAMQPHPQPVAQVQGQTQAHPQPQMQPQPQQQQASQHQLQTAPQIQPQAHSFVAHNQVNPQQASHPAIQPHPQLQSHNQPAAQVQNPQQQAYPQSQPHLFPHSMQPPVQQNFQAPQYQQTQSQGHQSHLQIQPQPHSHPQPPLQSHAQAQTQNHPHLHPLQPNSSQSQQPATHVVPGHQSHPPVQPQQQMLPGPPQQHPMHMHPSSGSLPPAAQFPQQSPHMRPPQGNASMPNQQQPNLMQTQGQLQGVPPAQHQQIPPQTQQGHLGYQRPVVQPMQQPIQQYGQQPYPLQASGPFQGPSPQHHPFTQQPMHTHSRPQGPTQSFQHSAVAFPTPPPHSGVQAPGVPPHQSQTYAGRPTAPNHAAPPQPFPQSGSAFGVAAQTRSMQSGSVQPFGSQNFEGGISKQQQMPLGQQFSESAQEVKHTSGEKNAAGQDVGSASKRTAGKDVSSSATGGDSVGVKALEFQAGEKSGDEEHRNTYEGENKGTHSGVLDKGTDAKANAEKIGSSETSTKKTLNDEDANGSLDPSPAGNEAETRIGGEKDGIVGAPKQVEYSSVNDSSGRTNENKSSQGQVPPQGSAVGEFGAFQDKGVINSSYPVPHTDQEKHQLAGPYGSSSRQQRPDVLSNLQSGPFPGAPPNAVLPGQGPGQLRPQGPGHVAPPPQSLYPSEHFQQSTYSNDIPFGAPAAPGFATSFSQGAQSGQQYQNNPPHSQPVFSRTSNAEPIGGPLHGPDGGAVFQNQRVNPFEGRYPDHHVSGPFDRGQYGQPPANEGRAPGFDTASGLQAKNGNDDHRNPFLVGPVGRFDQGEHQEAPRQYPKPSLMGVEPSLKFGNGFSSRGGDYPSHDFNHDPSRFLPPYHPSGGFRPNDIGERPTGFHEDPRARGDPARTQPEFLNSGAGFGMNRMPPRSPGREYTGIPSRGIGGPQGPPEGSRSFDISSDSVGKPFPEHFRNGDMVGQDFIPNHVRRGELFGPRNVQSHMRGVDGFGTFPDPHMGDFTGPGGFPNAESFLGNKSNHPRLGEPGFRSSYSLHGFPSDGGFYAGNLDPFDTFRKRMPTSMGWCRICKVDCDTVEGLDLHSQTAEHQQRTMDMVVSIKQKNAKRQKASKDHSSIEEGSRTRNAGNRGRGKKV